LPDALEAVVLDGLTGSGWLPPVAAQAPSKAEAAATENERRDRRGDDGFNEVLLRQRMGCGAPHHKAKLRSSAKRFGSPSGLPSGLQSVPPRALRSTPRACASGPGRYNSPLRILIRSRTLLTRLRLAFE
jgi:hypothetical protein